MNLSESPSSSIPFLARSAEVEEEEEEEGELLKVHKRKRSVQKGTGGGTLFSVSKFEEWAPSVVVRRGREKEKPGGGKGE